MFNFDTYCMEGEVWKPIPFYEDLYEVSSFGRVRSVEGKVTHSKRHGIRVWKGRILKNKTKEVNAQTGYRVSLWKHKKSKEWLVARLVAMAFLGIPKGFYLKDTGKRMTVNHKDGNRLNNNINNLEWVTLKENIQHAFKNGLMPTQHEIILIDKETSQSKVFRSKAQASIFLGKCENYVSGRLSKNKSIAICKEGKEYIIKEVIM